MTYQRREYVLADKLKSEFKERGKDVSGMRASSTSELMRRAAMGHDPRENCAEEAFRESYNKRPANAKQFSSRQSAARQNAAKNGSSSYSASRPAQSSAKRTQYGNTARSSEGTKARANSSGVRFASTAKNAPKTVQYRPETVNVRVEAKDTARKRLSPMFVALLGVVTVMIMFLVTQISDVYKTSNEIAKLENQLQTMQSEAEELKLKLDEKNDIREIEKIATTELGMAKEDTMQRRYITLSDGERIEVIDNGESEESSGGVMLSSVVSAIENLFN